MCLYTKNAQSFLLALAIFFLVLFPSTRRNGILSLYLRRHMFAWETIRFISVEIFWSILYFPVWWYTTGLMKVVNLAINEITSFARAFALKTLLKYMFKPMYGYTDIISRLISLYVRIGYFLVLAVVSVLYTIALFILVVLWVIVPPFVLYNLFFHAGLLPEGPVSLFNALFIG